MLYDRLFRPPFGAAWDQIVGEVRVLALSFDNIDVHPHAWRRADMYTDNLLDCDRRRLDRRLLSIRWLHGSTSDRARSLVTKILEPSAPRIGVGSAIYEATFK